MLSTVPGIASQQHCPGVNQSQCLSRSAAGAFGSGGLDTILVSWKRAPVSDSDPIGGFKEIHCDHTDRTCGSLLDSKGKAGRESSTLAHMDLLLLFNLLRRRGHEGEQDATGKWSQKQPSHCAPQMTPENAVNT